MNTPNNKRRKQSQERIEKIFMQLIQTKEIENISISDICKLAKLNRSTFYANYIDIYDLANKVKFRMAEEFAEMFINDPESGHNTRSYVKMFTHIKENQTFYKTYFKLSFNNVAPKFHYHQDLASKYYDNKHLDYHIEFFQAGLNAVIKKWLDNDCKESPEEIVEIINSEYQNKN